MPEHTTNATNGKATLALVVQIAGVVLAIIAAVSTPLIIMYSKIGSMEVQFSQRLREVETQFRSADEFRNINLAGQMRFNSLLWQKSYGEPFPQEVYFPAIANPR